MKKVKKRYIFFILVFNIFFTLDFIGVLLILINHYFFSYNRRIGDTHFHLVETMAISKNGKRLAGLYYEPCEDWGFYGGQTPGYPWTILWNDHYIISKNFDGVNIVITETSPVITEYVVINMDSIINQPTDIRDIHRFKNENDYYNYLKEIGLSEADMNQTDNHIGLW